MGYNFPNTPTVGTVFEKWTWDGSAWAVTGVSGGGGTPSDTNPLMDGTADPGSVTAYSRGDHIHPTDTSREATIAAGTTAQYWRGDKSFQTHDKASVGLSNVDNTSDVNKPVSTAGAAADALRVLKAGDTMSGPLIVSPKGSTFSGASGAGATTAVTSADANIKLYDNGGANWCGMGTDTGGSFWVRTGLSGSPIPALRIDSSGQGVTIPTTLTVGGAITSAGNAVWHAGNLTPGNYLPLSGGTLSGALTATGLTSTGEIKAANTLRLSVDNSKYLHWDGTNYSLGGSGVIWTNGNFNPASYLPLGGGTMTGALYVPGIGCTSDLTVHRSNTTGYIWLGNGAGGARYLGYDGTNYAFPNAHVYSPAGRLVGDADMTGSLVAWQRFPNGTIIQMGYSSGGGGADFWVYFPTVFPTACSGVICGGTYGTLASDIQHTVSVSHYQYNAFFAQPRYNNASGCGISGNSFHFFAWGY